LLRLKAIGLVLFRDSSKGLFLKLKNNFILFK